MLFWPFPGQISLSVPSTSLEGRSHSHKLLNAKWGRLKSPGYAWQPDKDAFYIERSSGGSKLWKFVSIYRYINVCIRIVSYLPGLHVWTSKHVWEDECGASIHIWQLWRSDFSGRGLAGDSNVVAASLAIAACILCVDMTGVHFTYASSSPSLSSPVCRLLTSSRPPVTASNSTAREIA